MPQLKACGKACIADDLAVFLGMQGATGDAATDLPKVYETMKRQTTRLRLNDRTMENKAIWSSRATPEPNLAYNEIR